MSSLAKTKTILFHHIIIIYINKKHLQSVNHKQVEQLHALSLRECECDASCFEVPGGWLWLAEIFYGGKQDVA